MYHYNNYNVIYNLCIHCNVIIICALDINVSVCLFPCRSAPPSPTHHPFIPAELTVMKDTESTFIIPPQPPPVAPHFTLPFVRRLPGTASHSLPASPSRLPHSNFSAAHLRFFPLNVRSTSTEALALESRVHPPPIPEQGEESPEPDSKRPCLSDESNEALEDGELRATAIQNPLLLPPTGQQVQLPPSAMPCFALPQATAQMRFPFMGLPVLAQPPVQMVPGRPFPAPSHQLQVERGADSCDHNASEGEREH